MLHEKIDLNDANPDTRAILTRTAVIEDIANAFGSLIEIKGRYYPPGERARVRVRARVCGN